MEQAGLTTLKNLVVTGSQEDLVKHGKKEMELARQLVQSIQQKLGSIALN